MADGRHTALLTTHPKPCCRDGASAPPGPSTCHFNPMKHTHVYTFTPSHFHTLTPSHTHTLTEMARRLPHGCDSTPPMLARPPASPATLRGSPHVQLDITASRHGRKTPPRSTSTLLTPKVSQLHSPPCRRRHCPHQDISRRQIAVHHLLLAQVHHRIAHLGKRRVSPLSRVRAAFRSRHPLRPFLSRPTRHSPAYLRQHGHLLGDWQLCPRMQLLAQIPVRRVLQHHGGLHLYPTPARKQSSQAVLLPNSHPNHPPSIANPPLHAEAQELHHMRVPADRVQQQDLLQHLPLMLRVETRPLQQSRSPSLVAFLHRTPWHPAPFETAS